MCYNCGQSIRCLHTYIFSLTLNKYTLILRFDFMDDTRTMAVGTRHRTNMHDTPLAKKITYVSALLVLLGLFLSSRYNYLLFHGLAELFSIVIACGIFMVAWNSRRHIENHYLLFIGIAYLFIGILDLVHTFAYKGMNIFPEFDANAPTQLWIAARYIESLTLLAAPLMLRRKINVHFITLGYGAVTALVLFSIMYWRIFPDCFLENGGGLTPFKRNSEYIISLILLAAGLHLFKFRAQFDHNVLGWLLASIALTIVSELSFTTYASVYGFSNLLGHYFKIASFFLIYKAIIQTGLAKPYDLLFRDLSRQREWLRVTLGSIGDAVIAADTGGRVTFTNAVAATLTAWPSDEAIGRPVQDILRTINEQTREPAENIVERVLQQGCTVNMANHTALISRHGREIPIEDSAAPIRDVEGQVIGAVIVFHDVTEQREIQAKLRRNELRYRELVQNANSAIIRWKKDGSIVFFNEYAQNFFGYSVEEIVGKHIGTIVPPTESSGADLSTLVQDIVEHPGRYSVNTNENICRDGRRVWMTWTNRPIFDQQGHVKEILAIGSDITARKKSEEDLQRSKAKFELLSNTSGRLLATEDPQGLVKELCGEVMTFLDCQVFFNFVVDETSGRLHLNAYAGIPENEAQTLEWLDFGTAVCGCVARDQQRIVAEDIFNTDDLRTDLIKSFGIQAYCCHPLMVGEQLIGTLSFGTRNRPRFSPDEMELMRTVTNQVALAMQRIQTQTALKNNNEELERKVHQRTAELASNLKELKEAHERLNARAAQLRALAGELTMAELRERRRLAKILHDGLQQHLAAAKLHLGCITFQLGSENLRKAALEIEEMLAESIQISRSLSAELSPPALHEGGLAGGLEWLVRWMREKHNFNVDLAVAHRVELRQDVKVLLFESLRELLFNAVKYAGIACARVNLEPWGQSGVRIAVSDDGAGFDPGQLNPTAGIGGGFGLFSIRERIGLIGGSLEIDSAPGKGSRFILTVEHGRVSEVPIPADSDLIVPEAREEVVREQCPAIRVLLVDDHAIFREGLARLLSREPDMEVVAHAKDALEAIALARKLNPHVILMDIDMPEINGLEATRIIHQMSLGARIIGLSMHDEQERGREMLLAGAVDYKNKGCAASELVAAIRTCVQKTTAIPASV
jgi:PAS domain S-box-containing protein